MQANTLTFDLANILDSERARVVRLCARITGDVDIAEDLAQETLLEAWQNAHKIRDVSGIPFWLSAIARNVCLRWFQRRGRDHRHLVPNHADAGESALLDKQPDHFDVEVELDRHELSTLLDRALALLPPETRAVLIARFVEETPLAEVAARLGMTDSVIKSRLHRGKLALRRVLIQDFPDEVASFGLLQDASDLAQETRIWCATCGQAKLHGLFDHERGELSLNCPLCSPGSTCGSSWIRLPHVFREVKGYRAALSRQMSWVESYTLAARKGESVACIHCGGPTMLQLESSVDYATDVPHRYGLHLRCTVCQMPFWTSLGSLALNIPEGQRFWREHPRIFMLPERCVDVAGTPALIMSHQARACSARFDVVFSCSTCEVLAIHNTP